MKNKQDGRDLEKEAMGKFIHKFKDRKAGSTETVVDRSTEQGDSTLTVAGVSREHGNRTVKVADWSTKEANTKTKHYERHICEHCNSALFTVAENCKMKREQQIAKH